MKQARSQPIKEASWRKACGKPLATTKRLPPCTTLVKSNVSALDNDSDPKNYANGSKIPRPKFSEWCSNEETSNGDLGQRNLKKKGWSISRSSSNKRWVSEKSKAEIADPARNEILALQDNVSEASQKTWSIPAQRSFNDAENSCLGSGQPHSPSASGKKELFHEFRGRTRNTDSEDGDIFGRKGIELNRELYRDRDFGERYDNEKEGEKRSGRVFCERNKSYNKTTLERRERNESGDRISEFENDLRERYDFTLNQISTTWKNAMELLARVRDNQEKLVEEGAKTVDKEQVALETEMLQLAIDFAMTYSKLKTDFFIKFARKNLDLNEPPSKTELETFMDSKFFVGSYSEQDLAEMAKTVRDLKASVLETTE